MDGKIHGMLRVIGTDIILSKQIRKLEEKVGGPLFTRTRRKVEITEAGREYLAAHRYSEG